MVEQVLNLIWVAIAIASFAIVPRQRRNFATLAAVAAILVLLFPIISATDDMMSADRALEEGFAAVLAAVAVVIALVAVARVITESYSATAFALVAHADPRSPPRR